MIASTKPEMALPTMRWNEIARAMPETVVTAKVTVGALASIMTIVATIIRAPPILIILLAERAWVSDACSASILRAILFQFLRSQGGIHSNNHRSGKLSSFFHRNRHIPYRQVQVGV